MWDTNLNLTVKSPGLVLQLVLCTPEIFSVTAVRYKTMLI